ncbi:MAG TPA: class I SAM-dependent methyltransferase [Chitinophagaceae bacterium]|jgi:SAM-dependent methyltransferase|nr:class I SAM-dependent methyltransferase [Chitinophagaceae bacterium]HWC53847.1 class I SAM-dependent methyltransferase [Chitinophagaceae bacterium]
MYVSKDFNPGITYPNYLIRHRLLAGIKKLAPSLQGRLLDLGCGAKPYKSLFQVTEYIGMDYESPGHSHENEDIDVFYDGKTIPFQNNYFDAIFSSEVFEHIFNLEQLLPEIFRVLKPGGLILVTCPFAICEHEVPNDYARYTSFALRHLFEKNGFEVISQLKTGNSVETVFQLWIMYIHQHITPVIRKIPILRSAFRVITYSCNNLLALLLSKILPDRDDLYLNNIILCRKKRSSDQ